MPRTVSHLAQCGLVLGGLRWLEVDPIATGQAEFGLADVFKDAAIALDGPRRGDICVVAGDENTF